MTRHVSRFFRTVSVAVIIFAMCSAAWGTGISIVPSNPLVKPGDDFYFDIVAEGIPASGLGGVQFRLAVTPSAGAATSVSDLSQAGANDIAIVTPLLISSVTTGHSGIGDFFWNGKGANGILVMDNEALVNGSALYTFAHTSGSLPRSGSGTVARFAVRIGSGVKAERLDIGLSDVMLMDGGPAYTLDHVSGASIQLRCVTNVPALTGLTLFAAQSALAAANLTLGSVHEIDNQNSLRPLNVVLDQSSPAGNELDCRTPVNLAINTPPADPANLGVTDKLNDESGTVALTWTSSSSSDTAGYRVYSGSSLLKQVAGAATNGTEIGGLANGVVTRLRITAYDNFGNESGGGSIDAIPLDDVKPVITLNGVTEGNFYRNDVTPQVATTDASPVTWNATLNGVPFTVASISIDGSYSLTISADDQVGNSSSKTVSFVVDKTVPTIAVTNVSDTSFYKAAVSPVVTISDTNLKTSSITLDGQPYVSGTTVSATGEHVLQINADDLADNSAAQTVHFTIDMTPPILLVSTLSNGSYTNNEVLNISGTVTDDMGIKELTVNGAVVQVQPDGSYSQALVLVDGNNTIEVKTSDLAGNPAGDTRTITLDQNAPLIDVTSPADNSKTGNPAIIVTGNVDETSTVEVRLNGVTQPSEKNGFAFTATLTPVYGINTIEVIVVDLASNRGTEKRTVTFDDQKPSLAVTEPGQDIRTNRAVLILKGTVADALTAVSVNIKMDGTTYTPSVINGGFEQRLAMDEEKSNAISVTATDEVGNTISVIRNVFYDVTPPELTIGPMASPSNQATIILTGTMEIDTLLSVTSTTATIGAIEYPTPTTWRATMRSLAMGDNTVVATSVDVAGNVTSVSRTLFIDTIQPTGSVSITGGMGFINTINVMLTLSALDETGIGQMQFSNDDLSWSVPENFAAVKVWDLSFGDGQKQVFVRYRDNAGNWSESYSAAIVLDTVAPIIGLSPAAGIYRSAQTVQFASSENAAIHCTTDGSIPASSSSLCNGPLTIATSAIINILAIDAAGNQSRRNDSYIIDMIPPILSVSTLSDGSYTNFEVLNISGITSDAIGVKELTINSAPVQVNHDGSFSHSITLSSGSNRIESRVTDLAGNTINEIRFITLDQSVPLLTVSEPADNSKTALALITVAGAVEENVNVIVKTANTILNAAITGTIYSAAVTLVPGINTIEIIAIDLAGNTSSQKRTVVYDDQSPSLAVTIPSQDFRTNQSGLVIRGTASSVYSMVTVSIRLDGQTFTPPVVNGQFEQSLSFSTEKNYAIVVTATSEVGNSTSVQRNVIYDATRPSLGIDPVISPTAITVQTINGIREAGTDVTVSCPTAQVSAIEYPTDTTWRATMSGMQLGANVVAVQAYDLAGNQAEVFASITVIASNSDVTFSVSPSFIWPPNHKQVPVSIGGKLSIPAADVQSVTITLNDEYGIYTYNNLIFGSTVLVEAWRDGADMGGRVYTITAVVLRRDGSKTTTTTSVIVPHDKGK